MAEISGRMEIEAEFARQLARLMGRHGNEAGDLSELTRATLEQQRKETEELMLAFLLLIFATSATQHGSSADAAQVYAQTWAQNAARTLASDIAQTTESRLADVQRSIGESAASGKPLTSLEIRERVSAVFGPTRAEGIAITQTTQARSEGAEWAAKSAGRDDAYDRWITEDDGRVCPVCWPLHFTYRSVWSEKFPLGPPAHVRCRCHIGYVNPLVREAPDGGPRLAK